MILPAHGFATKAPAELARLERRAARLLDAYLDGTVNDSAYTAKRQQLDLDIAEARVRAKPCSDQVDLTSTLKAAATVLSDPAGLWLRLDQASRQRFEVALFRDGLSWSATAGLRNRGSGCVYELLRSDRFATSAMAPPSGFTSQLAEIVRAFAPMVEIMAA